MKITEHTADQIVVRIDAGFTYDTEELERLVQRQQHRLTSEGFSVLATGRRDTIDGVSIVIEAVRFIGLDEIE